MLHNFHLCATKITLASQCRINDFEMEGARNMYLVPVIFLTEKGVHTPSHLPLNTSLTLAPMNSNSIEGHNALVLARMLQVMRAKRKMANIVLSCFA